MGHGGWTGNRTFGVHLQTTRALARESYDYPMMPASNDMPTPAETSGVELVCTEDKGNTCRNRNSWANTPMQKSGRASQTVLGKETFVVDPGAECRVKWAQRGIGIFCFFSMLCYIVGGFIRKDGFLILAIVCAGITLVCFPVLLYKNVSFVMMKRLLKEPNVIIIVMLTSFNWAIDIGQPLTSLSPIFGFIYMLIVNAFVLMDAVMLKSRYLMIGFGVVFVVLSIYHLYMRTLGDADNGVILVGYSIEGKEYTIMKRSVKRSIFLQVMLFSAKGIHTMFVDKSMKLMVFATGHIYKSTGKGLEEIPCIHDVSTSGSGRRSEMILGKEIFVDNGTEWRVKWAQRGISMFSFSTVLCYIIGLETKFYGFLISTIVCAGITLGLFFVLFYKNISFVMMKRLLKEPNVIIIVVLTLCSLVIDIGRPFNSMSPIFGFAYALCVNIFVLMDAVRLKSRYLMIGVGFVFVVLNFYNMYTMTLEDYDNGVILVEYSVEGKKYTIMKRSAKRSIFLQVVLFSAKGIYTMLIDKSMKLMVFATGNIYKSTGTASEEIEDTEFSVKVERELSRGKSTEVI